MKSMDEKDQELNTRVFSLVVFPLLLSSKSCQNNYYPIGTSYFTGNYSADVNRNEIPMDGKDLKQREQRLYSFEVFSLIREHANHLKIITTQS